MSKRYISKNRVQPHVHGYIVAWMSNQLTDRLPQWPQLRVEPEQEVIVAIDPMGGGFGLRCGTNPETVQVAAVIELDGPRPSGGAREYLLPFTNFEYERP